MEFHIMLDDVSITHLGFGKEYTRAVEEKQVAQQEAERAKFIVDKAQEDKKSTIIRAQGEAKSAELVWAHCVVICAHCIVSWVKQSRTTLASSNCER